ncbi:hypothetical protein FRB95_004881 [Tulasnella sp. JGI-2019a]|nr:hypothetical protein FRB95_004881 [Tulasnella sp. JGI-2019a]
MSATKTVERHAAHVPYEPSKSKSSIAVFALPIGGPSLEAGSSIMMADLNRDRIRNEAVSRKNVPADETPVNSNGFDMSLRDERLFLASLCLCLFLAGWNDATLGPLLTRIRESYGIDYTVVSLLFICQCTGFIAGAGFNLYLTDRFGFGKLLVAGAAIQVAMYAIMSPPPPFPVLCITYVINGFVIAVQDAQANTFIACIPRNGSTNMGILHSIYGFGGFTSPWVATQFASRRRWSFHFLVSMSIAVLNTILFTYMFRGKRQEYFIPESTHTNENGEPQTEQTTQTKYKLILRHRSVQLLSAYILVYLGAGTTIGGWIVTYLQQRRNGGPSAGYVSSGFSGGLTLGRAVLIPLTKWIGSNRVIYVYLALAIALEATIWSVNSLIGNAIAVSFVGLFLGPMYPIAMIVASDIIPPRLLGGAIGFISAIGQAGSAIFPFLNGALTNRFGVRVMEPLVVALLFALMGIWYFTINTKVSRVD